MSANIIAFPAPAPIKTHPKGERWEVVIERRIPGGYDNRTVIVRATNERVASIIACDLLRGTGRGYPARVLNIQQLAEA